MKRFSYVRGLAIGVIIIGVLMMFIAVFIPAWTAHFATKLAAINAKGATAPVDQVLKTLNLLTESTFMKQVWAYRFFLGLTLLTGGIGLYMFEKWGRAILFFYAVAQIIQSTWLLINVRPFQDLLNKSLIDFPKQYPDLYTLTVNIVSLWTRQYGFGSIYGAPVFGVFIFWFFNQPSVKAQFSIR